VADDDGVILVAREQAGEIMESARRRLDREAETRARLAAGELGLDLYGFRQRMRDLGVRWVESSED
jgi:4-hydroxy-4-methyl-2-oxoglutarate aldolase